MTHVTTHRCGTAQSARGVSLIFALLTLVALSLAAVALVRSVDTSSTVIGNLGFKQDSLFYAGQAAEEAIAWLDERKATTDLDTDNAESGYYATAIEDLDPTNRLSGTPRTVVDWNDDGCATPYASGSFSVCVKSAPMLARTIEGNSARYVISRLCTAAASATEPTNFCARPLDETSSEGGEKGAFSYVNPRAMITSGAAPYFRIIVRSVGARNTVSYTESIVHF